MYKIPLNFLLVYIDKREPINKREPEKKSLAVINMIRSELSIDQARTEKMH